MMPKLSNSTWILLLVLALSGQWVINRYDVWNRVFGKNVTATDGRTVVYWVAPMDPTYVSENPGKSPMGMDLVPVYEDELPGTQAPSQLNLEGVAGVDYYYTCGMHPNVHETEPGICPICNMNLVRKNITSSAVPGQVSIDPVTVQNIGVQSVPVERKQLSRTIRAVGWIAYDETRIMGVTTKVSGWAEKLYVDFTGQQVTKGDPLIDIYSPDLVTTQEEYLQALKFTDYFDGTAYSEVAQQSNNLLESTRKRLELWDITPEQIAHLKDTQQATKNMTLFSPISGIVRHRMITDGERIIPNTHLYEIADLSHVWMLAEIYEYELPWVKLGQQATMTLIYYPGKEFTGTISFIYPYLDAQTRTVKVRFEFDNPDMLLKPDMYANVEIASQSELEDLIIPLSSVIQSGERSVVILDLGGGKFEPREVVTGIESNDYYTIVEGLEGGEQVVTSAQFLIDSESRLREAQMKMLSEQTSANQPAQEEVREHTYEELTPQKKDNQSAIILGERHLTHFCIMEEDLVFSDGERFRPRCGMPHYAMELEERAKAENLIAGREIIRISDITNVDINPLTEYASWTEKTVLIIGGGAITHTCPMEEDLVFSSSGGTCLRCEMKLKELMDDQSEELQSFESSHEVLSADSADDFSIEQGRQ